MYVCIYVCMYVLHNWVWPGTCFVTISKRSRSKQEEGGGRRQVRAREREKYGGI